MIKDKIEQAEETQDQMEIVRRIIERINVNRFSGKRLDRIERRLVRLEKKIQVLDEKLEKAFDREEKRKLKKIHRKILSMLDSWMSTKNLAKILSYRQEYISRKVSELKKMHLIREKRNGKRILYKRNENKKVDF